VTSLVAARYRHAVEFWNDEQIVCWPMCDDTDRQLAHCSPWMKVTRQLVGTSCYDTLMDVGIDLDLTLSIVVWWK
jgi:hypothetical protein